MSDHTFTTVGEWKIVGCPRQELSRVTAVIPPRELRVDPDLCPSCIVVAVDGAALTIRPATWLERLRSFASSVYWRARSHVDRWWYGQ